MTAKRQTEIGKHRVREGKEGQRHEAREKERGRERGRETER